MKFCFDLGVKNIHQRGGRYLVKKALASGPLEAIDIGFVDHV
jgi:hypothetical protein